MMTGKSFSHIVRSAMGIIALALFACENNIETVNLVSHKENFPALAAYDISVLYTDSAKNLFNLRAPEIMNYSNAEQPYTEFTKGIELVYFAEYPDTNSMITANYAIRHDKEKYWEAKGNVIARNTKGETLNTEYMVWDETKEIIYSDKYVKIITNEDVIEGEGFEADQSFTEWRITKVTGFISIEDSTAQNE
jgi:LPS export ABC transporter protein LptC